MLPVRIATLVSTAVLLLVLQPKPAMAYCECGCFAKYRWTYVENPKTDENYCREYLCGIPGFPACPNPRPPLLPNQILVLIDNFDCLTGAYAGPISNRGAICPSDPREAADLARMPDGGEYKYPGSGCSQSCSVPDPEPEMCDGKQSNPAVGIDKGCGDPENGCSLTDPLGVALMLITRPSAPICAAVAA